MHCGEAIEPCPDRKPDTETCFRQYCLGFIHSRLRVHACAREELGTFAEPASEEQLYDGDLTDIAEPPTIKNEEETLHGIVITDVKEVTEDIIKEM